MKPSVSFWCSSKKHVVHIWVQKLSSTVPIKEHHTKIREKKPGGRTSWRVILNKPTVGHQRFNKPMILTIWLHLQNFTDNKQRAYTPGNWPLVHLKRKIIFQIPIVGFHANCPRCTTPPSYWLTFKFGAFKWPDCPTLSLKRELKRNSARTWSVTWVPRRISIWYQGNILM